MSGSRVLLRADRAECASHDGVSDRGPHRPGDEAPSAAGPGCRAAIRARPSSRRRGRRRPTGEFAAAAAKKRALPRPVSRSSSPRARPRQRRDDDRRRCATGAPAHPGGGVHGAAGGNTARAAVRRSSLLPPSRTDQAHNRRARRSLRLGMRGAACRVAGAHAQPSRQERLAALRGKALTTTPMRRIRPSRAGGSTTTASRCPGRRRARRRTAGRSPSRRRGCGTTGSPTPDRARLLRRERPARGA